MNAVAFHPTLGIDDYIAGERLSDIRHEYIDGQVYAMAGTGAKHNRIAGNIFYHLRTVTRGGSDCGVYISDMKVRIESGNRFYYPDVVVACDPSDDAEYFKRRPCLLVEVLSPSTEATDRREKWLAYRDLPSLRYYLLIASEEQIVEAYSRLDSGDWTHRLVTADAPLAIECEGLRLTLNLQDIYEDIRW